MPDLPFSMQWLSHLSVATFGRTDVFCEILRSKC